MSEEPKMFDLDILHSALHAIGDEQDPFKLRVLAEQWLAVVPLAGQAGDEVRARSIRMAVSLVRSLANEYALLSHELDQETAKEICSR